MTDRPTESLDRMHDDTNGLHRPSSSDDASYDARPLELDVDGRRRAGAMRVIDVTTTVYGMEYSAHGASERGRRSNATEVNTSNEGMKRRDDE